MIICYNSGRIPGSIMDVMRLVIWALFALQLLRAGDQPGSPASGRVRICLWDGRGSRNPIWVDSFRFCSVFLEIFLAAGVSSTIEICRTVNKAKTEMNM
jgi:hypothetical protein